MATSVLRTSKGTCDQRKHTKIPGVSVFDLIQKNLCAYTSFLVCYTFPEKEKKLYTSDFFAIRRHILPLLSENLLNRILLKVDLTPRNYGIIKIL